MTERCANCQSESAEPHDLLLRNSPRTEVYLCDDCHTALEREFVWEN